MRSVALGASTPASPARTSAGAPPSAAPAGSTGSGVAGCGQPLHAARPSARSQVAPVNGPPSTAALASGGASSWQLLARACAAWRSGRCRGSGDDARERHAVARERGSGCGRQLGDRARVRSHRRARERVVVDPAAHAQRARAQARCQPRDGRPRPSRAPWRARAPRRGRHLRTASRADRRRAPGRAAGRRGARRRRARCGLRRRRRRARCARRRARCARPRDLRRPRRRRRRRGGRRRGPSGPCRAHRRARWRGARAAARAAPARPRGVPWSGRRRCRR